MNDKETNEEKKLYTGITSLENFSKSVVMLGSSKPPTKRTTSEQKYVHVRAWMSKYSKRYSIEGNNIMAEGEVGVPIFPTEFELNKELGLSFSQFEKILLNANDEALLFNYPEDDIPELGIKKQMFYVIMKSLYPEIYPIVKNAILKNKS